MQYVRNFGNFVRRGALATALGLGIVGLSLALTSQKANAETYNPGNSCSVYASQSYNLSSPVCGDGVCDLPGGERDPDSPYLCLQDCDELCGNGICEEGEKERCPWDCKDTPTPKPTEEPTSTPTFTITPIPTPTDTYTPIPPTDTPIPTDTPEPTDTPVPTATRTETPVPLTYTPSPEATEIPATPTYEPIIPPALVPTPEPRPPVVIEIVPGRPVIIRELPSTGGGYRGGYDTDGFDTKALLASLGAVAGVAGIGVLAYRTRERWEK